MAVALQLHTDNDGGATRPRWLPLGMPTARMSTLANATGQLKDRASSVVTRAHSYPGGYDLAAIFDSIPSGRVGGEIEAIPSQPSLAFEHADAIHDGSALRAFSLPRVVITDGDGTTTISRDVGQVVLEESSDVHRLWRYDRRVDNWIFRFWLRQWTEQELGGYRAGALAEWFATIAWRPPSGSNMDVNLTSVVFEFEHEVQCPMATAEGYAVDVSGTGVDTTSTVTWNGYVKSGEPNKMFAAVDIPFLGDLFARRGSTDADDEALFASVRGSRMSAMASGAVWNSHWLLWRYVPPLPNRRDWATISLNTPGLMQDHRRLSNLRRADSGSQNGLGHSFGGPWFDAGGSIHRSMHDLLWQVHQEGLYAYHLREADGTPFRVRNHLDGAGESEVKTYEGWFHVQSTDLLGFSLAPNSAFYGQPDVTREYDGRSSALKETHMQPAPLCAAIALTQVPYLRRWANDAFQNACASVRAHTNNIAQVGEGPTRVAWRLFETILAARHILGSSDPDTGDELLSDAARFFDLYWSKFWSRLHRHFYSGAGFSVHYDNRMTGEGTGGWLTRRDSINGPNKSNFNASFSMPAAAVAWKIGQEIDPRYTDSALSTMADLVKWWHGRMADGTVRLGFGCLYDPEAPTDPSSKDQHGTAFPLANRTEAFPGEFGQHKGKWNSHLVLAPGNPGLSVGWPGGALLLAHELQVGAGDPETEALLDEFRSYILSNIDDFDDWAHQIATVNFGDSEGDTYTAVPAGVIALDQQINQIEDAAEAEADEVQDWICPAMSEPVAAVAEVAELVFAGMDEPVAAIGEGSSWESPQAEEFGPAYATGEDPGAWLFPAMQEPDPFDGRAFGADPGDWIVPLPVAAAEAAGARIFAGAATSQGKRAVAMIHRRGEVVDYLPGRSGTPFKVRALIDRDQAIAIADDGSQMVEDVQATIANAPDPNDAAMGWLQEVRPGIDRIVATSPATGDSRTWVVTAILSNDDGMWRLAIQ